MIEILPVLVVGDLNHNGKLDEHDFYDMKCHDWNHCHSPEIKVNVNCDNVNTLLHHYKDEKRIAYAELRLYISNTNLPLLLASFKKVKFKDKGYKWILVD